MSGNAVNQSFYNEVRSGFIRSGTTLNAWCMARGITRQYAEKCLKFQRNGPKAYAMRELISKAAGLPCAQHIKGAV